MKKWLKTFFEVFFWGYILLLIFAIITSNNILLYPYSDEDVRTMWITLFIFGSLFVIAYRLIKKWQVKKK